MSGISLTSSTSTTSTANQPIQLSGLASGFDWKPVVNQLIAVSTVPQNKLKAQQVTNNNKLAVFSNLNDYVTSLQTSINALKSDTLFSQRTVALGNNTNLGWTAAAASSTASGTYNFNVTKLATATSTSGGPKVSGSLSATNNVSSLVVSQLHLYQAVTAGTFTVNGKPVSVATTDTLADVFSKISTATGGAVTASYDTTTDKVTLQSSGAITLGGGGDTSNFLYAMKLYNNGATSVSSASAVGAVSLSDHVTAAGLGAAITAVDGSGNGSFSINGVAISYNVNTDSLQSIMTKVNSSAAGVTMSYDASNDHFKLSNNQTGNLGLVVSEASGGLIDALKLSTGATVTQGVNAEFSVNGGGTIVSGSNTLTGTVHGIAGLSVTATSLGQQTITVGSDTKAVNSGIQSFISAYNTLQQYIDAVTQTTKNPNGTVTASILSSNHDVTDLARQLRAQVFGSVTGLSGAITQLASIGIDFNGSSSQLTVKDGAKLSDALANNPNGVAALFTSPTYGITSRLNAYITNLTNTNGLIQVQENSLKKQNTSLDLQIADWDRRLLAERNSLTAGFVAMESAQSKIQSQQAALTQMLK